MTQPMNDSGLPTLYTHTLRKEWGVGVLAGESAGRRRYLFENGEERIMANAFQDMMREVERPSQEQQAIYAKLRAKLAAREGGKDGMSSGEAFLQQLTRLTRRFPAGVADPSWVKEVRGDNEGKGRQPRRNRTIEKAQELLSAAVLDSLLSAQKFGEVLDHVRIVLEQTDLVPVPKARKIPAPEHARSLAIAVRELLHGTAPYDQRFDRHAAALSLA
jgi:hypothetical protein